MELNSWRDLPYNESVYLGDRPNGDACNRYKLTDEGFIEIQNIYRYVKPSKTIVKTPEEFDKWLKELR